MVTKLLIVLGLSIIVIGLGWIAYLIKTAPVLHEPRPGRDFEPQ